MLLTEGFCISIPPRTENEAPVSIADSRKASKSESGTIDHSSFGSRWIEIPRILVTCAPADRTPPTKAPQATPKKGANEPRTAASADQAALETGNLTASA